jgi:hypothetical protein
MVMYEDLRGRLAEGTSTVSFDLKTTEDGCQVDSIYTYFSNPFDIVGHCLFRMSSQMEPARICVLTFLVESST